MPDKYINEEGLVGVIISPGFGAGFHSWNDIPGLCFDKDIIKLILDKKPYLEMDNFVEAKYGRTFYVSTIGLAAAQVHWVKPGTQFFIDEYDGAESITLISNNVNLLTA